MLPTLVDNTTSSISDAIYVHNQIVKDRRECQNIPPVQRDRTRIDQVHPKKLNPRPNPFATLPFAPPNAPHQDGTSNQDVNLRIFQTAVKPG